jgi:hypothetical protein
VSPSSDSKDRPSLAAVRWRFRRGESAASHAPLLARIASLLAEGRSRNTKRGRRKELYRISLGPEPGRVDFLLKRNRYAPRDALRRAGRGSKSRHELRLAEALAARGLPTVVPLAAGEERHAGLLTSCWLLVPYLDGARDLLALAGERALAPAARRALCSELGALARASHEAGLLQDDFAPNNFLRVPGPVPTLRLIDFERARLGRGPASHAWRCWMLAKLERALPDARASERLRFLVAYAGGDREAARRWWRDVDLAGCRLAARDVARRRRQAVTPGRRFRVVSLPGVTGFARRELDETQLAAVLDGRPLPGLALRRFSRPALRSLGRLWADGQVLAERGLGVESLALVARGGEAMLVAREAEERGRALPDEVALRLLLRRLLRLGRLDRTRLARDAFVAAPGSGWGRALLADPRAFHFATRTHPGLGAAEAAREARRIARELVPADSVEAPALR